ncbi:MAG: pyridoxal phosphate-dependent aminotransferase [Ruminococcaceae bacterium]|nr:pyridoxal phosphate-dependent aminotransferase [Oscillospiraceae bacterium]
MPILSKRSESFTESVIRRMTRISDEHQAINLSQGFPDFDPPRALIDSLHRVADAGPHQYAVTWGDPNFRNALAKKHEHFTGQVVNPLTELVVTCGSTEAMMCAMMTVCNPGDKVIVFSPFYENYGADAILSGAEPIFVPLVPPAFNFDPEVLENAFRQGPKAIVVCNPSNPTGKVFTRDELMIVADLAKRYDCFVITDEVYEHIVYAPHVHTYMCTLPGMKERTLVCNSLSKTYSITGWRLGYVIGPAHVIDAARKVHDFLTVGAPAPLQEAAVAGLTMPDSYYEDLCALYTRKRAVFCDGLERIGLTYTRPQGAYYVMIDVSEFAHAAGMRPDAMDDNRFCEWLASEIGVGAVPGSSFFREPVNHLIRMHFAKQESTLNAALERLDKLRTLR